jgi:hypothetical protein
VMADEVARILTESLGGRLNATVHHWWS